MELLLNRFYNSCFYLQNKKTILEDLKNISNLIDKNELKDYNKSFFTQMEYIIL